ncbi:FbpB family small basic protein [Cytobacillus oceanisediminis]|uniref:Fur-regulated basic protein B n=1 Tax=Cytobacillus oceanisediminis TaxID=665099 RepID=A0A562JL80_9BACI|nr:FbpB family small basic protein [Cytobacillus oceanisediminis]TWH84042.1 Fur-regulated basic protein B [Cytobacillus oceanisediminis]
MKKPKISFTELIKKNKEELLKDREQLAKIEKRVDEKYTKIK